MRVLRYTGDSDSKTQADSEAEQDEKSAVTASELLADIRAMESEQPKFELPMQAELFCVTCCCPQDANACMAISAGKDWFTAKFGC